MFARSGLTARNRSDVVTMIRQGLPVDVIDRLTKGAFYQGLVTEVTDRQAGDQMRQFRCLMSGYLPPQPLLVQYISRFGRHELGGDSCMVTTFHALKQYFDPFR